MKERGVALEELDHTQYNWSGGNSHDERRVAAIGLKKLMQEELSKAYEQHGRDYYDKVFIIAHSHGGTISRLAMNLWDKDDDYYDPVKTVLLDELKHDDECPTCLRIRNGTVGRNSVQRPDGVITFGSPFVSFEPRSGGLLTARLSAWVLRLLIAAPFALVIWLAIKKWVGGPFEIVSTLWSLTPFKTVLLLVWPLALYWMVGSYLPRLLDAIERRFGKNVVTFALGAVVQTVKYLVLTGVVIYYLAYVTGGYSRILGWLPWNNASFQAWLGWAHLVTVTFFVLVAVPGAFLLWLGREVVGLRAKLPIKYDPAEDRAVPYVSYHTPGDEAGVHLRIFGVLTWVVQTLALSAACVLTFGIVLAAIIGVEAWLGLSQGGGVLNRLRISAVSDFPEYRDNFIKLIDMLTYLPKLVWTQILGVSWLPTLGDLDNRRDVVWFIPAAIVLSILIIFLFLMPFVALAIAVAYLASMWLRSSGVVFGSEKLSWNLANQITVMRHANANTALRVMFISPEAWWQREIAHSYYYRSRRVIRDVAERIAEWSNHRSTPAWPIEAWLGSAARLVVVLLFVLSIVSVSVPIASAIPSTSLLKFLRGPVGMFLGEGPGSIPDPTSAQGFASRGYAYLAFGHFDRSIEDYTKAIELEPNNAERYSDRGVAYRSKRDFDQATVDLNKAIELDPAIALYWLNRGNIYEDKGDTDRALAEYTKAIELAPDYSAAYSSRGGVYEVRGAFDLALADHAKAVEISPSLFDYARALGVAKYGKGDFAEAAADLGLPIVETRKDLYSILFRYLARTRAGESAAEELQTTIGPLDKQWPYAVGELYLGKRTVSATLGAARNADERCQAQFYIGQWHILKNSAAEAANALKVAAETCRKTFIEYRAAVAELKRLSR